MRPGEITAKTLDVRNGRALEQAADEIRSRSIGSTLIDWWLGGADLCYFTIHNRDGTSTRLDLRHELRQALQVNRRSITARLLVWSRGFAMVWAHPDREAVIGRDMIDWFRHGHHRTSGGFDLRVMLNNAVDQMQKRGAE